MEPNTSKNDIPKSSAITQSDIMRALQIIAALKRAHEINKFQTAQFNELVHDFCKKGDLDKVRSFIINNGVDVFSIVKGSTLLHKAVLGNNFDLIEFLLHRGLNINAKNKKGGTPLHELAVFSIKFLGIYRDCVTIPDEDGKRMKEYVDMIEFLVDNGADVNAYDNTLEAPLKKSIYLNLVEISECFLELKADIEFRKEMMPYACRASNKRNIIISSNPFTAKILSTRIPTLELLSASLALKEEKSDQYINAITYDFDWVEPFFQECRVEANEMKQRYICEDRNISFYNFLRDDVMKATVYSRSEEVMRILKSEKYKEEFPCYEYLLKKRIERVQLLRNYVTIIMNFLEKFSKKKLPIVVLDQIISYLRAGDVRNFGRALTLSKN